MVSEDQLENAAPGSEPRDHRDRRWLWVLIAVLIVLLAFLLLSRCGRGAAPLISQQPGVGTTPVAPQARLTVADARAVLGRLEYSESADTPVVEYEHAITHVNSAVDVPAFVESTLETTDEVVLSTSLAGDTRPTTGAERRAVISDAVSLYRAIVASVGPDAALRMVLGGQDWGGATERRRNRGLLDVVLQGIHPLNLMFGPHDVDDVWTWRVERIVLTGADTANVVYSARTTKGATWKFANPSMRYVKHLRFVRSASGRWLLSGWTNYPAISVQFDTNISPRGADTRSDEWFGAV